jgi:hypothetical protein
MWIQWILLITTLHSQRHKTHKEAKEALTIVSPQGPSAFKVPPPSALCALCGVSAANLKACTRHRSVVYCSRECQVAHWKAGHKEGCQTRTMPAQFRVWMPVCANPAFRGAEILISFS